MRPKADIKLILQSKESCTAHQGGWDQCFRKALTFTWPTQKIGPVFVYQEGSFLLQDNIQIKIIVIGQTQLQHAVLMELSHMKRLIVTTDPHVEYGLNNLFLLQGLI